MEVLKLKTELLCNSPIPLLRIKKKTKKQKHYFEKIGAPLPRSRKWQPTPVFLPGKSHGQRSQQTTVHGVTESDMTEHTHTCSLQQYLQ